MNRHKMKIVHFERFEHGEKDCSSPTTPLILYRTKSTIFILKCSLNLRKFPVDRALLRPPALTSIVQSVKADIKSTENFSILVCSTFGLFSFEMSLLFTKSFTYHTV